MLSRLFWILIFGTLLLIPSEQNHIVKSTNNDTAITAPCPPICPPQPLPSPYITNSPQN